MCCPSFDRRVRRRTNDDYSALLRTPTLSLSFSTSPFGYSIPFHSSSSLFLSLSLSLFRSSSSSSVVGRLLPSPFEPVKGKMLRLLTESIKLQPRTVRPAPRVAYARPPPPSPLRSTRRALFPFFLTRRRRRPHAHPSTYTTNSSQRLSSRRIRHGFNLSTVNPQ